MTLASKAKGIKLVLKLNHETNEMLNNRVNDLKTKYSISDDDLFLLNACISMLTSREILNKMR